MEKPIASSSPSSLNRWSYGKTIRIPISGEAFNWRKVTWKGKTELVEYDMLTLMVKQWMKEGMSKEECLDLMFDI